MTTGDLSGSGDTSTPTTPDLAEPPTYRADWYPDPYRRFEFRYHNGRSWTADVSFNGQRTVDGFGNGPSMPYAPVPPTGAPYAPTPSAKPKGRGLAITGVVLGAGALLTAWLPFVFVASAVAALGAIVLGIGTLRRNRGKALGIAAIVTGGLALPACLIGLAVTREMLDFIAPGDHLVEIRDCTLDDGLVTVAGTIENLSDDATAYTINVDVDVSGLELLVARVPVVQPGDTAAWEVSRAVPQSRVTGDSVSCTVRQVFGPEPFGMQLT